MHSNVLAMNRILKLKNKMNMKNLIKYDFIAFVSCFLFSCNTATTATESQNIEGCEYIVTKNSYGNGLTHKGNCKNTIHKCNCN